MSLWTESSSASSSWPPGSHNPFLGVCHHFKDHQDRRGAARTAFPSSSLGSSSGPFWVFSYNSLALIFLKKGINLPIFPRLYSFPDHVPKRFYFLSSRQTPRFSRYSLNFQTRSKFLNYLNLIKSDNVLGRNVNLRVLHDLDYQAQNTAASLNQRL